MNTMTRVFNELGDLRVCIPLRATWSSYWESAFVLLACLAPVVFMKIPTHVGSVNGLLRFLKGSRRKLKTVIFPLLLIGLRLNTVIVDTGLNNLVHQTESLLLVSQLRADTEHIVRTKTTCILPGVVVEEVSEDQRLSYMLRTPHGIPKDHESPVVAVPLPLGDRVHLREERHTTIVHR